MAYTLIATQTLTTATGTVTFSSIPGTYKDLVLEMAISATVNSDVTIRFNSDSSVSYSQTWVLGNGTSASSGRFPNGSIPSPTQIYLDVSNTGVGAIVSYVTNIMSYANTNTHKTLITRYSSAGLGAEASVGLWRNTSAITSFTLSASFAANSTFKLWGVS